jgi:hypothetical protein
MAETTNALPHCCHIDRDNHGCADAAEWEIWDGIQPYFDHYTHACTDHVGAMLTDRPQHRVYRLSQGPTDVPRHKIPAPSRCACGCGRALVDSDGSSGYAHPCAASAPSPRDEGRAREREEFERLMDEFAISVAANAAHMTVRAPPPADAAAARAALLAAFDRALGTEGR